MNARIVESLGSRLDEERVETLREEGGALTADEAATLALEALERRPSASDA